MKKLVILMIASSIFTSCGYVETSCEMGGKNELCYGLLGDDKVDQNEYDKDQEELESFKEEVREQLSELNVEMNSLEADIETLDNELDSNHSELSEAILGTKEDLLTAIGDLDNTNSAQLALIRGLNRKIRRLKRKIREIKEDYNDLSISCEHYYFFLLSCELNN